MIDPAGPSSQGSGESLPVTLARAGEIMSAFARRLDQWIASLPNAWQITDEAKSMSVTYKCPECGLSEPECLENSNKRAYELLWEHLSPNQQYTLWWVGGFVVPAPASRSQYIVTTRNPYGVYRAREESLTVDARLCAYPKFNDRLWMGDLLLAQKLWLETDPVAFEHVANIDRDRTFVNEVNGDWRVVGGLRDAVEKPERPESLSTLEREMISNMDREMVQIELRTVVVARKEACYWAAHYKVSPGSVSKRASLTI